MHLTKLFIYLWCATFELVIQTYAIKLGTPSIIGKFYWKYFYMDNFVGSLSDKLILIRDHFGYSNSEMARKAGISSTAMDNLINGQTKNTKTNVIGELATKLGINLNWLVNGEGDMFKEGAKVNSNNKNNSHNNTINESRKTIKNNQTQEVGVSDASKDVVIESLKREVEFLKKQLEYTQGLLEKAMSK